MLQSCILYFLAEKNAYNFLKRAKRKAMRKAVIPEIFRKFTHKLKILMQYLTSSTQAWFIVITTSYNTKPLQTL